jgi:hypothetical protein
MFGCQSVHFRNGCLFFRMKLKVDWIEFFQDWTVLWFSAECVSINHGRGVALFFCESMHMSFLIYLFAFWSSRPCIYTSNRTGATHCHWGYGSQEGAPAERSQCNVRNGPNWIPYQMSNGKDNSGYKFSIGDLDPATTGEEIQAFWVAMLPEELWAGCRNFSLVQTSIVVAINICFSQFCRG